MRTATLIGCLVLVSLLLALHIGGRSARRVAFGQVAPRPAARLTLLVGTHAHLFENGRVEPECAEIGAALASWFSELDPARYVTARNRVERLLGSLHSICTPRPFSYPLSSSGCARPDPHWQERRPDLPALLHLAAGAKIELRVVAIVGASTANFGVELCQLRWSLKRNASASKAVAQALRNSLLDVRGALVGTQHRVLLCGESSLGVVFRTQDDFGEIAAFAGLGGEEPLRELERRCTSTGTGDDAHFSLGPPLTAQGRQGQGGRAVFFVGHEGSGHHLLQSFLPYELSPLALWNAYGRAWSRVVAQEEDRASLVAALRGTVAQGNVRLVNSARFTAALPTRENKEKLRNTFSFPFGGRECIATHRGRSLCMPDLVALAEACAEASTTLVIAKVERDPRECIASNTRRHFGRFGVLTAQFGVAGSIMRGSLDVLREAGVAVHTLRFAELVRPGAGHAEIHSFADRVGIEGRIRKQMITAFESNRRERPVSAKITGADDETTMLGDKTLLLW